jgi:hypothetical protein
VSPGFETIVSLEELEKSKSSELAMLSDELEVDALVEIKEISENEEIVEE